MSIVFQKRPPICTDKTDETPMQAPSSTKIQRNAPAEALTKPTKPRNQGEPMADPNQWGAFEREVMEVAGTIRQAQAMKYADATPADVARDLDAIDKALTTALQVLGGLDLEHEQGQDLEARPYNWPVASALASNRWHLRLIAGVEDNLAETEVHRYPSHVIEALRKMRNAARKAAAAERPGRGNSASRRESSKRAALVGMNFAARYLAEFRRLPPISQSGPAVDLLGRTLIAAGLDGEQAPAVMRRAVKGLKGRGQVEDLVIQIPKHKPI